MKPLPKFFSLPPADQYLLVKCAFLMATVTVGLRILSFQTVRVVLTRLSQRPGQALTSRPDIHKIVWAVKVAGCYVPAATCLPQALVGQLLLKQQGHPAQLYIGVAKNDSGQLEAHAWVESYGQIVIGLLPDLARFTPLGAWERRDI